MLRVHELIDLWVIIVCTCGFWGSMYYPHFWGPDLFSIEQTRLHLQIQIPDTCPVVELSLQKRGVWHFSWIILASQKKNGMLNKHWISWTWNPIHTKSFWLCAQGHQMLMTCAPGTMFDSKTLMCNHMTMVSCSTASASTMKSNLFSTYHNSLFFTLLLNTLTFF